MRLALKGFVAQACCQIVAELKHADESGVGVGAAQRVGKMENAIGMNGFDLAQNFKTGGDIGMGVFD